VKIFSRLSPFALVASPLDPLKLAALGVAAWSVLLGSCSQTPVTVNLHALQASGQATFLCRGDDNPLTGHKLDECPDRNDVKTRRLYALVTQTATNEVAVIDLAAQAIVDIDPSTPGYSFLRVGARPGAIVTTPGGAASFVGVTGLGKDGIFALPSTCLTAPQDPAAPALDLTSWSACHLSSAPGDITVVLDATEVGGAQRVACDSTGEEEQESNATPRAQFDRACPADVTHEKGPRGRRKLLVALPDEHKLVLLDAQRLLDRAPGQFTECAVERDYPLAATQPATPPAPFLPDDLQLAPGTPTDACVATAYPHQDSPEQTPGGMANAGDTVYVADRTAPVVHRIDVSDPCSPKEQAPLLPYSYLTPLRAVTTSRVAVSPLTPTGKQYVYAIDDTDLPSSVMAFDVSPDSKQVTPLVLEGAARQPYLPPDRLRFSAAVRDISFVMRDFPVPDASGAGQFGLQCSPFAKDTDTPSASYRPNPDFTDGARPINLRGLFGFAMLTNGQIAVIDVEDFDAPCRRPKSANLSSVENFRGCKNDVPGVSVTAPNYTDTGTIDGISLVSDESSCRVIEAHRPRAASLSRSDTLVGLRAPSLRAFPQFANPDPSSVITFDQQPHLVAANYPSSDPENSEAQVNVSSTQYQACDLLSDDQIQERDLNCLAINPATPSLLNSLTLPLKEPRSYAQADENLALVFEGSVLQGQRTSGFLSVAADGPATINDPDAGFCNSGVQDSDAIGVEADSLGIPGTTDKWRQMHADYVQLTGDFPAIEDSYWSAGAGQSCQALLNDSVSPGSHDACEAMFGNIDNPAVLNPNRDLSINAAYNDRLEVKPRGCTGNDCALKLDQLRCCFPSGTAYTVRASRQWLLSGTAGLNDIAADSKRRCVHTASCDRRKQYWHSRAFEVCTNGKSDADGVCQTGNPNVGCAIDAPTNAFDVPAGTLIDALAPAVDPGKPGSACIFENLTSRFVVYRGAQPSVRGMAFTWQTTGGFAPLTMTLTTQTSAVNPQSLGYIADPGFLTVIDSSTLGLTLFDLNSLGIVLPSPYF
jgi:hypothetical protein